MRTFFLLLLSALSCFGQAGLRSPMRSPDFVGNLAPWATGSSSDLINTGFELTGTEAGWTDSGVPDWDYTGFPLEGSQSWLSTTATDSSTFNLGANYDTLYLYFLWYRGASSGGTDPTITLYDATDVEVARFAVGNGALFAYNGSAFGAGSSDSAQVYSGWFEFTKGTGSDGIAKAFISTTTTKPAVSAQTLTGDATTGARKVKLSGMNTGTFLIDHLRVRSTSPYGDNPP